MDILGNKIRMGRKNKKLTQKELADLLDMDHTTVSKYESGAITPTRDVMIKLSRILDIPIEELFSDEEVAEKKNTDDQSEIDLYDLVKRRKDGGPIKIKDIELETKDIDDLLSFLSFVHHKKKGL